MGEFIQETIHQQPITLNVPTVDLLVGENYNLAGQAGISITPNRDLVTYSRSERLSIPLTLFQNVGSVGVSHKTGLEAEFIRQFSSQAAAINLVKSPPYGLAKIPNTAARALDMKVGDYYRYQANMSIGLSGALLAESGIVSAKLGYDYSLYGDFQIEVYRKDKNQVFVRASSLKQKTNHLGGGIGKNFTLRLFEMGLANKLVDGIIPDTFIELDIATHKKGTLFTVEYKFDLSNAEAAMAYDSMVNPANWKVIDVIKVLNPINGGNAKVQQVLKMTVAEAEKISKQDKDKSSDQARVVRELKSHTDFVSKSSGLQLNLLLIDLGDSTNYVEQNFSYNDGPGSESYENYRIATTQSDDHLSGLFSFGGKFTMHKEKNILFRLNEKKEVSSFEEINFSFERSDKKLKTREVTGELYQLVPGLYQKQPAVVDFINSLAGFKKQETFVDIDVVLDGRSFLLASKLTADEIASVVEQYIGLIIEDQAQGYNDYGNVNLSAYASVNSKDCPQGNELENCLKAATASARKKIKQKLTEILAPASSPDEYEFKWKKMVELQKITLFKEVGSGLLIRLIERGADKMGRDFLRYAYFRFTVRGTKSGEKIFEFGRENRPLIFDELIRSRNRIFNRTFDPEYFNN